MYDTGRKETMEEVRWLMLLLVHDSWLRVIGAMVIAINDWHKERYKIGKSKSIIDRIDDYIGPLYGLSPEEIEFIKNYEIEFRMNDED